DGGGSPIGIIRPVVADANVEAVCLCLELEGAEWVAPGELQVGPANIGEVHRWPVGDDSGNRAAAVKRQSVDPGRPRADHGHGPSIRQGLAKQCELVSW